MADVMERIWKETAMAYSRYYPGICLEGLKKTAKNFNRLADAPAEVRTKHLRNTRLKSYRHANPLGDDADILH
jgi:hypothetical protein